MNRRSLHDNSYVPLQGDTVPISAVVLTHNEEANIEATLRSVSNWAQEIFVVDSGSTDQTKAIAKRYTHRLYDHDYADHGSQWSWALANLPFGCEWMLLLDSDFIVTEDLKRRIGTAISTTEPQVAGFFVKHRYVFRGKPIRFGGTKKWWLRVVRHQRTKVDGSEKVDFRLIVDGEIRKVPGLVLEDNRKEYDIDFWIDKHQKFSTRMAAEELLRRAGRLNWNLRPALFGNQDERIMWLKQRWYFMPLFVRPFLYFLYRYFLRLGFLDGWQGFLFHFLQGFWFRLVVDVKMRRLAERVKNGELTLNYIEQYLTSQSGSLNAPLIDAHVHEVYSTVES